VTLLEICLQAAKELRAEFKEICSAVLRQKIGVF